MTILFLIARILYGGFFLFSGINHFTKLTSYTQYAASKRVPAPAAAVIGGGVLLVLGGLSVVIGAYPEIGLILLAVFLLLTTPMMHRFWAERDPQWRTMEMVNFMKNVALLGAALMMIVFTYFASGPWPFRMVQ
ncbi:MAG TPA: DoxX family membrane protein [Candidatus Acidoferrales bacterium]|nr:DoxX family membrane protein [Candidatus Acidoferrales bacterium]